MRPGPVDIVRSGYQQGCPVPLLVIAGEIETEAQAIRADMPALESRLDTGIALVQPVAIADHTEAEGILVNVDGGVALAGPALLGVIEEAGKIQVKALFAFPADFEIHDHVVGRSAFGYMHPDLGYMQVLFDAVPQALKQGRIEILTGDLAQLGS